MTTVCFKENKVERRLVFLCEGHSGYAKKGSDIVCSAVTVLSYVLAKRIEQEYMSGNLIGCPEIVLTQGRAYIEVICQKKRYRAIKEAFEMIKEGYCMVADQYPENVKLVFNG